MSSWREAPNPSPLSPPSPTESATTSSTPPPPPPPPPPPKTAPKTAPKMTAPPALRPSAFESSSWLDKQVNEPELPSYPEKASELDDLTTQVQANSLEPVPSDMCDK